MKHKIGYMCGVDFQHELGEALGDTPVYSSIEELKREKRCWKQCGIVEVKIQLVSWAEKQNFEKEEK